MERHPSFSFHFAEIGGTSPCSFAPTADAPDLVKFICEISASTWREVRAMQTGGRKRHRKHHEIPVGSVIREAQDCLTRRRLDEVVAEDLFRFRVDGKGRLWGFERDGVFYVLWWDADHEICPSEKSHT